MDGVEECRGSVLLKGVRGFFLEIFEKSIDKHKIDAILNAPSFCKRPDEGCLAVGGGKLEDSTEESGITIPIQRAEYFAGSFYVFMAWKGTVQGYCALCLGVFFEKC